MRQLTIEILEITNKKTKAKSTLIVDLLKKRGISGIVAVDIFQQYSAEYVLRKCWLLDYMVELGLPIKHHRRWLQAAIKNDYKEPDHFLMWLKRKKEYILKDGNEDLKQLLTI